MQLRARVALLESSLRQALEGLREERQLQEHDAALPAKVLCGGSAMPAAGEADIKLSCLLPSAKFAYVVRPPPGLPPPAAHLPPSSTQTCRSAFSATLPRTAPPGLDRKERPQFLQIPSPSEAPTCSSQAPTPTSSAGSRSDDGQCEAPLRVLPSLDGAGAAGACVEWRVDCLHMKLRANCGFPLISPAFSLGDLAGLRLMFIPGAAWAARQVKSRRKQQTRGKAGQVEGPRNGAVQLKAASPQDSAPLRFHLVVGGRRQGPCYCDFAEHAVQGCDIDGDWLQQMDREAGCLHLRLEFF
mmetsp:Transcript_87214/g.255260  ORF Transcript_87214/g.255260 Transcript_87214/m.255260 type:complete len:299 (-) Transcript_87214:61-957(-)